MNWQNASILKGLSQASLEELSQAVVIKTYTENSTVISDGEQGVEFFIVDEGSLRVVKDGHVLDEKYAGNHFGLMAVFDNSTRSADVVTSTHCTLAVFNWKDLSLKLSETIYQQIMSNQFKELQSNIRSMNKVLVSALVKNEELIDQVHSIREKLSIDLHDDVGSLLAGLSMQSELLILQGVEHSNGVLEEVGNMSKEAMKRLRDIVWAVDSRNNKFENLIDKMRDFAAIILMEDQFTTQFDCVGIAEQDQIKPANREHIYFIFKEALHNIVKHSNGDRVWIKFAKVGEQLILSIKDNGTNRVTELSDGSGLKNMKMRAGKIGGELKISSGEMFGIRLVVED